MREALNFNNDCVVRSVKEVTSAVRAVINSKNQKLTDNEVLELIEDLVLENPQTTYYSFDKKSEIVNRVFNTTKIGRAHV